MLKKVVHVVEWLFDSTAKSPSGTVELVLVPWFYGTAANKFDRFFYQWQGGNLNATYLPDPEPVSSTYTYVVMDRYDGYGVSKRFGTNKTIWSEMATVSCEAGGQVSVSRVLAMMKSCHWTTEGVS